MKPFVERGPTREPRVQDASRASQSGVIRGSMVHDWLTASTVPDDRDCLVRIDSVDS